MSPSLLCIIVLLRTIIMISCHPLSRGSFLPVLRHFATYPPFWHFGSGRPSCVLWSCPPGLRPAQPVQAEGRDRKGKVHPLHACVCLTARVCVFSILNSHCVSFSCQGSYGVVKLAYNEDDNTYYVSRTHARHKCCRFIGVCRVQWVQSQSTLCFSVLPSLRPLTSDFSCRP